MRAAIVTSLAGLALLQLPLAAPAASTPLEYRAQFRLEITAREPTMVGRIRIVQPDARLKRLELDMPSGTYSDVTAPGRVKRRGDVLIWDVPAKGGELRYRVAVDHRRNDRGYDALLTDRWGVFRAEDVFPSATATHRRGARSRSELSLEVPRGWSAQTPYLPDPTGQMPVVNTARSFVRPVGWLVVGELGSRMDRIGSTTVRVAGPSVERIDRVPTLALLRWTLPILQAELTGLPAYLLIVRAGDPMWRGGLSAPNSLFLHATRPLLSENGTSPLMHELMHVLAPVPTAAEHDWIDEGLAEYVGLLLVYRSGSISRERFDHAIEVFRQRGAPVRNLLTRTAQGAVTARAVTIFHDLDEELRARSDARRDLFDVLRRMMREERPIDLARLRAIATEVAGGKEPLRALSPGRVPGAG